MKIYTALLGISIISTFIPGFSQEFFNEEDYKVFRNNVEDISASGLGNMFSRPSEYYWKGFQNAPSPGEVSFLDSVILKFKLTNDELGLLEQNQFMVTERLSFSSFGQAFHEIYNYDLPVFITTDAVLHALHTSYDQILKTAEREIMSTNLEIFLQDLYSGFGSLKQKYGNFPELNESLADAGLYITIAYSLITDRLQEPLIQGKDKIEFVWKAIHDEKMASIPLFTYPSRRRNIDFSQFRVRGHYVYTETDKWQGLKSLEPYFRAMMWLGRIDFLLTPPPENPWETPWTFPEIKRMHLGAFLLNELVHQSGELDRLELNEKIIDYLVGESDNLTPGDYQSKIEEKGITSAVQLLDSVFLDNFKKDLESNPEFGQKILSDFYFMNPNEDEPGVLPISYKLSGQRFIFDSYILGNVVFDRIVYEGQKIFRMMPDPLDVLFVLGNNDVVPMLEAELTKYPYSGQLASLRWLLDHKPDDFWNQSLYNVWLNSLRKLNPVGPSDGLPLFMGTAAWHQQKMNTQLASWSQLRHDNLLYAKQSYTGGTGCSFPYSVIEPYPEFYGTLKLFAGNAGTFFSQLNSSTPGMNKITGFFSNFSETMGKLQVLAEKEINSQPFLNEELNWLKSMLFHEAGSGIPPYTGWYTDLFFDKWDASDGDFTVVDIHTQPTDEFGNPVGRVLHTGTGKINLGVFIAKNPAENGQLMAFTGPVISYYQKIEENYYRLTDQEWEQSVLKNNLPARPDWTRIYLADEKGRIVGEGRELPSKFFTVSSVRPLIIKDNCIMNIYPNPVKTQLTIAITLNDFAEVKAGIYNLTGTLIWQKQLTGLVPGQNFIKVETTGFPAGIYLGKILLNQDKEFVFKIIKE